MHVLAELGGVRNVDPENASRRTLRIGPLNRSVSVRCCLRWRWCQSSVARAAILRRIHRELVADSFVVVGFGFRLTVEGPSEVGDQCRVTQMRLGVAVALQAPTHRQLLFLPDLFHEIHPAVAGHARDTTVHVGGMVEVGVVREVVHANPADRLTAFPTLPQRFEQRGIFLDAWQFMHVWVGGIAAWAASSTVLWQYRQSIPSSPACSAWE